MLAYKVVEKKTRYSSNAAMWLDNYNNGKQHNNYHYYKLDELLDIFNLRKYILKYSVGSELHAIPDSPGIMCFKTYKDAQKFIDDSLMSNAMIIEVDGYDVINDGTKPLQLIKHASCLTTLVSEIKELYTIFVPTVGLITFSKVTVLS